MRLVSLKLFFLLLFASFHLQISAQKVPKKPDILYPVYDKVGLLSDSEREILNQKLIKFSDSTSTEIEVIIIPTTGGEDVNYLATLYGEQWGIGQKDLNNGIVFLIATEDRKMSIQQGRSVEKYLTASVAGQIIDYLVTPYFKQGQYYEGINRGTSAIMDAVKGKYKPLAKDNEESGGINIFEIIIIVFILILVFSFLFRNNDNGGNGNFDDDEDVILSRRGRRSYPGGFFPFPGSFGGGGFGGGSSGGGFGGFGGGGSFGGGGASGGW